MIVSNAVLTSMGVAADNASKYVDRLNEALPRHGIDTPLRVAHFLAQVCHESIRMSAVEENLNYSAQRLRKVFPRFFTDDETARRFARQPQQIANRVYGGRLGNTGPDDGWRYRGRGLIQLTGKDNYRNFASFLRQAGEADDIVADPDLVASKYAVDSAVWFWTMRGINAPADRDDVRGVTRAINGGLNGLDDRVALLRSAKRALAGAGADQQPKAARAHPSGKAPDALIDAAFAAGWATGKKDFWKLLPADSGEWAQFWDALDRAADQVDRTKKPNDAWIDAAFAAGWAKGDPGFWKRLDPADPQWSHFFQAITAAVG